MFLSQVLSLAYYFAHSKQVSIILNISSMLLLISLCILIFREALEPEKTLENPW